MKGKSKPKMMAKKGMKKMAAKTDKMPGKGAKGAMMKRLENREM